MQHLGLVGLVLSMNAAANFSPTIHSTMPKHECAYSTQVAANRYAENAYRFLQHFDIALGSQQNKKVDTLSTLRLLFYRAEYNADIAIQLTQQCTNVSLEVPWSITEELKRRKTQLKSYHKDLVTPNHLADN